MTQTPLTRSLQVQLVFSFMLIAILAAAVAGIPALWIIHTQLSHQAWAQIDQGAHAAQALYAAEQTRLGDLASLTAQRPTLRNLLAEDDHRATAREDLESYLSELQAGAGSDLIGICLDDEAIFVYKFEPFEKDLCSLGSHIDILDNEIWLLAAHPITNNGSQPGLIIIGQLLDDSFAAQMRDQTGLEHVLWANGELSATSMDGPIGEAQREILADPNAAAGIETSIFTLDHQQYYAARAPLDGSAVEIEVVLPIAEITATQRQLILLLTASIIGTTIIASGLGMLLARRFSRPLIQLAQSAAVMRKGDLDHEIVVDNKSVFEVAHVAQVLERARSDLKEILSHLRQEKDWSDHLLESMVEGIVTLDNYGRITFFSSGASRIIGWSAEDALGKSINEVFKPADDNTLFSELIPPPGKKHKVTLRLPSDLQTTIAVTGARLTPRGEINAHVALVLRDISEEEALNRLLEHFLSNMAHEFRTPLSALAASSELLIDQSEELSPGEYQELMISLHLGILGIQTLIDNLLESASIEARRFRVSARPIDLGQIVGEAAQIMSPLLRKYEQHLVVECPIKMPVVMIDPRRTVQVLVNLISNANKYGPTNAEIIVKVTKMDKHARIEVIDHGPGISEKFQREVFRRFARSGRTSENDVAGVGLGLYVVKAIVEAQKGEVGVENHSEGGACFWFTTPLAGER